MQIPTPAYDDWDDLYSLIRDLSVCTLSVLFLLAIHRVAKGLMLGAQVKALDGFHEAYAPDEREVLIRKIKHASLRG